MNRSLTKVFFITFTVGSRRIHLQQSDGVVENVITCQTLVSKLTLMGAHEEDSVLLETFTGRVIPQQVSAADIDKIDTVVPKST